VAASPTPAQPVVSRRELLERLGRVLPFGDDSLQRWVEQLEFARDTGPHGTLRYEVNLSFGRAEQGVVETRYEGRRR
jgi:hypothetical protein